jgi:hypothetical protein
VEVESSRGVPQQCEREHSGHGRGAFGTMQQIWSDPDYRTAVLVRLEDGRYELF